MLALDSSILEIEYTRLRQDKYIQDSWRDSFTRLPSTMQRLVLRTLQVRYQVSLSYKYLLQLNAKEIVIFVLMLIKNAIRMIPYSQNRL